MEFLRFGSSIPGSYWGCCACCIIQDFNQDPDQKMSIQLVGGDGGNPVMLGKGIAFAGPTYRDIFNQRIRFGTFDKRDMPNHAFLAILTENQISGSVGRKWLAILREAGFEFIRSVANSVYTGQNLGKPSGNGSSMNHIFGLFRNIGTGASADPFTPPKQWTLLPFVVEEAWERINDGKEMTKKQHEVHTAIWNKIGPPKLLTEAEVVAAGAPVIYAGLRSQYPQQPKDARERTKAQVDKKIGVKAAQPADPFGIIQPSPAFEPDFEPEYDEADDFGPDDPCGNDDCEECYPQTEQEQG